MNIPVSFKTAKLLKLAGYNIPQNKMYSYGCKMFEYIKTVKFQDGDKHQCANKPHDWNSTISPTSAQYFSAPTLLEASKWLKSKYGIAINMTDVDSAEASIEYYLKDRNIVIKK